MQIGRLLGAGARRFQRPAVQLGHACVPFAGIQSGFFAVPDIGSGVWIEFEQGDPDYPIWVGCFWGSAAESPRWPWPRRPDLQQIVIQTAGQNTLMISDVPGPTGGILLKSTTGAMISISDTGITISNGQGASIVMTGPAVTVNEGATRGDLSLCPDF